MTYLDTSIYLFAQWIAENLGLTIDFAEDISISPIDVQTISDQLRFGRG